MDSTFFANTIYQTIYNQRMLWINILRRCKYYMYLHFMCTFPQERIDSIVQLNLKTKIFIHTYLLCHKYISSLSSYMFTSYIICNAHSYYILLNLETTNQYYHKTIPFHQRAEYTGWDVTAHAMLQLSPVSFFRINRTSLIGAPNIISSARI